MAARADIMSAKNKIDSLFPARLFVLEQQQIALWEKEKHASEKLKFSSPFYNKLLRNGD